MHQKIIQAIKDKQVLEIHYHGYTRVVEPHTFGVTKKGRDAIRGYQTAGGSVSGESPGWKVLCLDEIVSLQVSGDQFEVPRQGYKRGDLGMTRIYKEI
jgi:predicted DNA-binding transcriptional regulator YafY